MKKLALLIVLLVTFISMEVSAQVSKDSWVVGAGGSYPRLIGISPPSWSGIKNYGGFLSLQRNFSEHVGLRIEANYYNMETKYRPDMVQKLKMFAGNGELLYYLAPCEPISPFISAGFGIINFKSEGSPEARLDDRFTEYQFNFGLGAEWRLSCNWKVKTELKYHTPSTNRLDGRDDPEGSKGVFGGNSDTYMTMDLGVLYYFGRGEKSGICDLYSGIREPQASITKEEVEKIIVKYLPKEIIKEVIVTKEVEKERPIVFTTVHFKFNKAVLGNNTIATITENLGILLENPTIKVVLEGHTDNVGSAKSNLRVAERRANIIKDYLVARGVAENRIKVKAIGESMPLTDNISEEGRALNRRVEFKIWENK